ncbi:MAG: helix-turn-helix transcriptional regulator [Rhodocyclaceae bacterium]
MLEKKAVGERLKKARTALGLTQKELFVLIEMPVPSLQDYEAGKRMPGGDALASLIRAGINTNWLLTGKGPMLLADLVPPAVATASPAISVHALEAILEGALKVAPNAPAHALAKHCAGVYKKCIEDGLIAPEGIGSGNPNEAV